MTRQDIEREAQDYFDERDCPHAYDWKEFTEFYGLKEPPRNDPAHCIACLTDFAVAIAAKVREEDAEEIETIVKRKIAWWAEQKMYSMQTAGQDILQEIAAKIRGE